MRVIFSRSLVACFCLSLFLLSGCQSLILQKQDQRGNTPPTLTVLGTSGKQPVSPSFIGMNIELANVCTILQLDQANPTTFEQLFKNLGSGTLHIGGHSVDESSWQPGSQPSCQTHPVITESLVQQLFAFAHRIHWNVIWGLNFLASNPGMDANEAAYVAAVGGHALVGFTMGNEPEDFPKHGYRPTNWGYNNFRTEWQTDYEAVIASVPSAHFVGPEACCESGWFPAFLQDEYTSHILSAASHHFYYYSGQNAANANLTAETMLSPQAMSRYILEARGWVAAADQYNLPVDVTEMNSITNGGIAGISNTFAATLWMSDILFQSATIGIHQIDFQEVPDANYAFINDQGDPQAIYNGLLFFHLATHNSALVPSVLNSPENVSSYVLQGSDHRLRVVLINKTSQGHIKIAFTPGANYHTMNTLHMKASSLTATSGVTIGNTTVDDKGNLQLPAPSPMQLHQPTVTLDAPANSATLFTFLP